jgi:hypothetical protein
MTLQDEIDLRSTEVKSDSYSMSIGELTNLYQMELHHEIISLMDLFKDQIENAAISKAYRCV